MDDTAIKKTINHFFKVQGYSTNRCHEPSESCDQLAIRSHSIPSSNVLRRLASDGHVVMPHVKLKVPPPAEIQFKRVGVNRASTFTGLCERHDNDIFQPIDDGPPDLTDERHLFLLAYRAVLREYHVVLQNGLRLQSTYQKQVKFKLSPGTEPCDMGMFATANLCNAYESYEYKRKYDLVYLSGDYSELDHHVLLLKEQKPTIAVSAMFSLDDAPATETPRVTLSIFPTDDGVAVVFSAIKADAPFVGSYLERLLASDGYYQKYLISKLVLQSCDNFVINPNYFDKLRQDRQAAICEFYVATILGNGEGHEDERLYLF